MEKRHYSDYFNVPQDYKANMTREAINETPETWLDFFPHSKYVDFLATLLEVINGGSKSIWLSGNYGTGKSNVALVTQKLFMDDTKRVRRWFESRKNSLNDRDALEKELFVHRKRTLVVYDYNASGVGPNEDFLVRLEKGIIAALKEYGMTIPAKANLDSIIERIQREGDNFFKIRDSMQDELAYLNAELKTVKQLINKLNKEHKTADVPTGLINDVQKVLHKDNIYLNVNVQTFRDWIKIILSTNTLSNVVYIFDEFSEFIDSNKEHLKTFEDVTENPGINNFFLVPVTHLSINAYWAEGSENAKKANDRFYFRDLKMPNDTAFRLAADAMKPNPDPKITKEWKAERDTLWNAVSTIADQHFESDDVSRESFYCILPIHPMAAFLLKFLAESARSNQRSIFEYLKGSADGHEFQDFIRTGGPGIKSKQFLTVDYLWKYFMERNDLGLSKEIIAIRDEYERIKKREFSNLDDNDADIRVLKTVLLFCLLARLTPAGHERLLPTVQNIELSFQGDVTVVNIKSIINNLVSKHCFSVVNNNIGLFAASTGSVELQAKIAENENKFHELLSEKTEKMLEEHTKGWRGVFSSGRFEIRVSDASHTTLTNIPPSVREKYSQGQNKDNGTICLWFVVAKNKEEQLKIPDKIRSIFDHLHDHRILIFTFPNLTFCSQNTDLWKDYVSQYTQYMLENDTTAKDQHKKAFERLEREWFDEIKKQTQGIKVYFSQDRQITVQDKSWNVFKTLASGYVQKTLPACVDYLTEQNTVYGTSALSKWAMLGIQFETSSEKGQYKQLLDSFMGQGISTDDNWYAQNPQHPFTQIHLLFNKMISNTIDKGSNLSIREVYFELQSAPYGMKNNALSAFVLGFVLRDIIINNYQWDNGQKTGSLDTETLADIIETVVKDDGNNNIRMEKTIRRLSEEDKAFIEKAPLMFGITNTVPDVRIEDVILHIQSHIERISERVPLWVLPEYIHSVNEPQINLIENILDKICIVGSTSSKGKTEERSNAIKDIGTLISSNANIVETIAGYVKRENFVASLHLYIDKTAPELKRLAEDIGDISHGYCRSVMDKAAETAGLLWKQADISKEINETILEYEVVKLLKLIIGVTDFIPYKVAIEILCKAVTVTNKLPKSMIESAEPSLSAFLSSLQIGGSTIDLKDALKQNTSVIKELFFDSSKAKTLELLRIRLNGINISDADLLSAYNGVSKGYANDETTFLDDLRLMIENNARRSTQQNIKTEWKNFSSADTPSAWAISNGLPVRFIFGDLTEANLIINAIEYPENFSLEKLIELLDILKNTSVQGISECQKAFIAETIPKRFEKFNITLSSLLVFLEGKYGKQPNNWPVKPDIHGFIREQYKGTFAPQVMEIIQNTSAEDLKKKLLQLAQDNPDLGLLFWE